MELRIGQFISKIVDFFGYEKARTYVTPSDTMSSSTPGMGKPTQQNYKKYLKQYTDTAWVFTCIQRIASQGSSIKLRLYKKTIKNGKEVITEIFDHPINTLLKKVNPFTTGLQLLENTISFEELTGNAYWLLDAFENGKPTEIYSLRPDRVKIIPDPINYIKAFTYEIAQNKFITFKPEQVIHFKYFNSMDDYYGLSPISAGRMSIDTQKLGDEYNKQFYANSAQPRGALFSEKGIGANNKKRIAAAWRVMHQGNSNAHKIAILEGGLNWKALGLSQKDMDFIEQKKMTREDIMGVFGVPPAMVGVFEFANYANSREQREIFWRNTEVPKLSNVASIINEYLVKPWNETLEVAFDYSTVDALQTDINVKATTDEILTRSGIKTINEAREERGLIPVAWGNVWHSPMNLAPVDDASGTIPEPTPAPPSPEEEGIQSAEIEFKEKTERFQTWCLKAASLKVHEEVQNYIVDQIIKSGEKINLDNERVLDIITQGEPISITPIPINVSVKIEPSIKIELPKKEIDEEEKAKKEVRTKLWFVYKDLIEDWEKKYLPFLRKEFKIQEDETLMNLEDLGLKSLKKDAVDDQIDKILFDKKKADKALRKGGKPLTEGALTANAEKELAALGLSIAFDITNPKVQEFIDTKVFKFANDVNINTQKKLRNTLKKSIAAGESMPQAQVRIKKIFKEVSEKWAGVIARTEVVSSTNAGAMAAYKQSEVVKGTEWITSRDADVRDTHQIDGETIKLGGIYSNGLQFPGDPSASAEEVVNCRCTQRGIVK